MQEAIPERLICAQCGTENPPEANTYSQCRTPLIKENP
jgi:ribosomal protein L40E